jgi:DNA-binding TFAR19-related protein (PDSD5 family)
MVLMSDRELEALKAKRLRELQKRLAHCEPQLGELNGKTVLNRIFKGRAWEVFNCAKAQFPAAMVNIECQLVNLGLEGKITQMQGEQLYALLREIGLRVKLNTTIQVNSHGKTTSLSDKIKGQLKE